MRSEICVCLLTVRAQREFFFDYLINICEQCGNRQSFYIVCSRIVPDMMMPLQEARVRQTTKRKRVTSTEVAPTPDPPPQSPKGRRKELRYLFSRPTPKFWDHLSRVWLTRSALQEFDRRTVQLIKPKPKYPSGFNEDSTKELKHFARQGGPSLCDLRGVGSLNLCLYGALLLIPFLSTQEQNQGAP